MNHLLGILRIILPTLIAWGLVSACKEGVDSHIGVHEVLVFNSIEVSLKIEKNRASKIKYVNGTTCASQGEDISNDVFFNGNDYYYLDVTPDHILCVPEGFALEFRVTGTYNNDEKRDLTDSEIMSWINWTLPSQYRNPQELEAVQHNKLPPKIVRVYDTRKYGSSVGSDGIARIDDITGDSTGDVKLNALFKPNQLNANSSLKLLDSQLIPIHLLEPVLEEILIIVNGEATSDDFCDIIQDSSASVVEGCLKQFRAIGRLNNDLVVDLTENVEWLSDDPVNVAKFLTRVTSISDEVQGRDWADYENPSNTKVVKFLTDNGLFVENSSSDTQKGLVLAKSSGQFKISAAYAGGQKYNRGASTVTGWYITPTLSMNVVPPKVRDMKLSVNPDSIGNPEFGNVRDPSSNPPKYKSAVKREAATGGSGYIYTMIENTNANLVAYGVYENKMELSVTSLAKWSATERDGTQDITSDNIVFTTVKGNIEAKKTTDTPVTITAEKDAFKKTMKIKVEKERLLGVMFEPKLTDASADYHFYYTMKETDIKNIRVKGEYSNSGMQQGRISANTLEEREARLNYFAEWVETFRACDPSGDQTTDLLTTIKPYATFQEYLDASVDLRVFPVYFKTKAYDGTSDLKVKVGGVYYDMSNDTTHDATYEWRVIISKEGLPPVNVEVAPDPYTNTARELWIAEKPIQLEAVGIYSNGQSLILNTEKVAWTWILPDKIGCDNWSEWSENNGECLCDIGYDKKPCVIGNGLLLSHQNIHVRATSTEHSSQFDTVVLDFGPSGQTLYKTELLGVRLTPQNVALEAGNIGVLGAEGVFDNGRAYLLHNSCLEWRVTSNSTLVKNADGSGILHPDPGETFVVLRIDRDAGTHPGVNDSIRLQVDTKSPCDYVNWQKIDAVTSDSTDLSITALQAIKFFDAGRSLSVDEGSVVQDGSPLTGGVKVQRVGVGATKKITGFYSVENLGASANDYGMNTDMFVIEAGQTEGSILFTASSDSLHENPEKVRIKILRDSLVNARLHNNNEATLDITINDLTSPPNLALLNASPTVNETVGTVLIEFSLDAVSGRDITLNYTIDTANSSCDSNDHNLVDGSATIPKGLDKYSIRFDVSNDLLYEATENLKVNITSANPSWSAVYNLTIIDNDKLNIEGLNPDGGNQCGNNYKACAMSGSKTYSFIPKTNAQYPGADLEYTITQKPSWASVWNDTCQSATYNCSATGKLSGDISSVGDYKDILICVQNVVDGGARGRDCLAPFTIKAQ